ncbi:MAG: cbb3-type cytochrome c oxidase N-terminal domain-containing protein [Planctomycetota bacterium JB042]
MTELAPKPDDSPTPDSEEILRDHSYDGIQEYDNPLPGWWVWTWIATIVFCFPYLAYYHGAEGRTLGDEYEQEVAEFADMLLATYGELEPDRETLAKYMTDPVAMAGMKSLFKSKCTQCHRADGSGMVGPNLTDDSWLHVKEMPDIFTVLDQGVEAKGMPAWGPQLSKTQIVLMSAYVASLRETPKPGKEPQGEVIPPWSEGEGAGS